MHEPKRLTTVLTRVGPWSGIAAITIFTLTDLVLSIITPDYNAVGETTSQLMNADAQYSLVARTSLGIYCVLITPFILSAVKHLRGNQISKRIRSSALWLHLLASITAVAFQNESPAIVAANITVNEIHDRSGEILFAAALIAILITAITEREKGFGSMSGISIFVAAVMAATGLGLYFQSFPDFTGVLERIGLLAIVMWILVIEIDLLRSPQPRPEQHHPE